MSTQNTAPAVAKQTAAEVVKNAKEAQEKVKIKLRALFEKNFIDERKISGSPRRKGMSELMDELVRLDTIIEDADPAIKAAKAANKMTESIEDKLSPETQLLIYQKLQAKFAPAK